MTDFQFSPSQFTVPAGQEITLDPPIQGAVIHNFIIMNLGQNVGTEFDEEDDANIYWKTSCAGGSGTHILRRQRNPVNMRWYAAHPVTSRRGWWVSLNVVAGE
jgi:hypothetical protein